MYAALGNQPFQRKEFTEVYMTGTFQVNKTSLKYRKANSPHMPFYPLKNPEKYMSAFPFAKDSTDTGI